MNKFFIIITILILSISSINAAPKISVKTAILIDYDSDEILYESDADLQIYPASMTKIMTSIIVFDLIKSNRLSLDDKFVVSENACECHKVATHQCL